MIRRAEKADLPALTELALALWPGHSTEDLEEDLAEILGRDEAAFFLGYEGKTCVGFAQCQLRNDYVEGTDSTPVGYLEGIYVVESRRGRGIARSLLVACESWAKSKGCTEFASDCELSNTQSLHFHKSVGFEEANRIICFRKQLK